MKRSRVVVPWRDGLHFRPAAELVRLARKYRASVYLLCGRKVANLRSVLGLIALCATMGTPLDVEAVGEDEQEAVQAVQQVFSTRKGPDLPGRAISLAGRPAPARAPAVSAMSPRSRHRARVNG